MPAQGSRNRAQVPRCAGMLTALDIIVLVLIGGGLLLGAIKGFVAEALSLFAWFAAVFVLKLGHGPATALLMRVTSSHYGAAALAFVLLFGITFFLGKLVASALGRRTRQSVLGGVDRLLGAGFGALKGLIVATILFLAANLAADLWAGARAPRPEWLRASRTYPLLNASGQAVLNFVHRRRDQSASPDNSAESAAR